MLEISTGLLGTGKSVWPIFIGSVFGPIGAVGCPGSVGAPSPSQPTAASKTPASSKLARDPQPFAA
jgi:hypothetical protein